jgi:hypothetical protein
MNSNIVVNQFDLDDFDCFLANELPVHPATILAKKLAKLLRSVNPGLCNHGLIVQLKDGSFFLRYGETAETKTGWCATLPLTRKQAFALLVANCFALGNGGDDAHAEFAADEGAFLDMLAQW